MAYTLLDLQTSLQDDLKDSSFSQSRLTRYLNAAQRAIFHTHAFKFCEKAVSGALTVGQYAYDQQADHEATIGGVVYNPVNKSEQFILDESNYVPHRQFFEQNVDPAINNPGLPTQWTEFGNQIYFDRPADKAYQFRQRYYKTPAALSTSIDIPTVPESFRELLENYALYKAEKYRENHDIAATYRQEYEEGLENMALLYSPVHQMGGGIIPTVRVRTDV